MKHDVSCDFKNERRVIEKGWGREIVIANERNRCECECPGGGFSGKILQFDSKGAKSSMHLHIDKTEYFYIYRGSFLFRTIDPMTGREYSLTLQAGETYYLSRGTVHQLEALEDNSEIFEVASHDQTYDSIRIRPGDSQSTGRNPGG